MGAGLRSVPGRYSRAALPVGMRGAERIYGYRASEMIGKHVDVLYSDEKPLRIKLQEQLNRAAAQGHVGNEDWNLKKDGSRFWANVIMVALKDDIGDVTGLLQQ